MAVERLSSPGDLIKRAAELFKAGAALNSVSGIGFELVYLKRVFKSSLWVQI